MKKLVPDTVTALRFFTRLPVPNAPQPGDNQPLKLNEVIAAFPLAGLIIAILPAFVWYTGSQFFSSLLAASLAILLGTLITGALHEDGLADSADGLGGATTKERALEIMRDSAIGTYGATALIFSFAIRIFALASLNPWLGVLALFMTHSTARASIAIAIHTAQYARKTGLGESVRDGTAKDQFNIMLAITLFISLIITLASGNIAGILAPALGMFAAWLLLKWLIVRLGGYTGDGLGAMEQVSEISILIALAALWS
ncbi:MAG: adenosylcobinamide-GDP ribazoletransferase [Rhizobiaceae bacterium]|nr:adenosylcobinamide-GDP ribazoletransferase [Rhizobiaceae bacterium]